jgi:O-acetylhomoserine/O-acetylserine sulfhydrylase-like pyridoxal-dependent enzyme
MSAIRTATDPFLVREEAAPRPNIVSCARVYGGTFQQFWVRRCQGQGIEVRWVTDPLSLENWEAVIDSDTRFVYGEFPSNPSVTVFDIEAVAALAHRHGIPFIVDSTCASPALTRPLVLGADIVVQSASKVMGGSGTSIVGLVISRKEIPSKVGSDEMRADFAAWAKLWPFRDNGPALSPLAAVLTLNDIRTLRMRVAQMSRSTMKVARFLESHPRIARVHYPGLASHPGHRLAERYMRLVDSDEALFGHMLAAEIKEDRAGEMINTRRFYDALDMIWRATDLGRVKTVATLNAISTHQQQGEEGRRLAAITPSTCRISCGLEDPQDIIADLDRALSAA